MGTKQWTFFSAIYTNIPKSNQTKPTNKQKLELFTTEEITLKVHLSSSLGYLEIYVFTWVNIMKNIPTEVEPVSIQLSTNVVGRYRDKKHLIARFCFDFPWMKPAILSRRGREEQQIWVTTAAWLPRPLTPVAEWTMLLKTLYSEHDR